METEETASLAPLKGSLPTNTSKAPQLKGNIWFVAYQNQNGENNNLWFYEGYVPKFFLGWPQCHH